MQEVRVAVIADAANVAPPGKLNVLGIFDTVLCRAFPALHPFMVLVLRIDIGFEEAEKDHEVAVSLKDEDLKEHARAVSAAKIGPIPAGRTASVQQILQFAGMTFTKPGSYRFHVSWDGKEIAQVPLHVLAAT